MVMLVVRRRRRTADPAHALATYRSIDRQTELKVLLGCVN